MAVFAWWNTMLLASNQQFTQFATNHRIHFLFREVHTHLCVIAILQTIWTNILYKIFLAYCISRNIMVAVGIEPQAIHLWSSVLFNAASPGRGSYTTEWIGWKWTHLNCLQGMIIHFIWTHKNNMTFYIFYVTFTMNKKSRFHVPLQVRRHWHFTMFISFFKVGLKYFQNKCRINPQYMHWTWHNKPQCPLHNLKLSLSV